MDGLQAFEQMVRHFGPGAYRVSPTVGQEILKAQANGHKFRTLEEASTIFIDKRLPGTVIEQFFTPEDRWLCG